MNLHNLSPRKIRPVWFAGLVCAAITIGLFLNATEAFAQAKPAAQAKRTSVNFEDQLIEGQTQKPELFYLLQQRNNNYKRLIRLRENFLPEMRKTAEDMSR
jgi:uncharacterized protein YsxB (DUF464 family)